MKIDDIVKVMSPDERKRTLRALLRWCGHGKLMDNLDQVCQEWADMREDDELRRTAVMARKRREELRLIGE